MKLFLTQKIHFLIISAMILLAACQESKQESELEYKKDSGLVEINGTQLYTHSIGKGEPIIVLHGGPGMEHGYLLPHLEMFVENYQLIFYDQRASGKSSFNVDSASMAMANFVEDIEGLKKYYGIEKVNLMGHSWGGLLAMWYAKTYPENLNSLVLVNSIGASQEFTGEAMKTSNERVTTGDQLTLEALSKTPEFLAGDSSAILAYFKFTFGSTFYDRTNLEKLNLSLPSDRLERQKKLTYLYPDLTGYDLHEELKTVTCPTLIIHGEYDANPLAASEKLEEHFPNGKLVTIPNCGHWAFIEAPAAFYAIVEKFMRK